MAGEAARSLDASLLRETRSRRSPASRAEACENSVRRYWLGTAHPQAASLRASENMEEPKSTRPPALKRRTTTLTGRCAGTSIVWREQPAVLRKLDTLCCVTLAQSTRCTLRGGRQERGTGTKGIYLRLNSMSLDSWSGRMGEWGRSKAIETAKSPGQALRTPAMCKEANLFWNFPANVKTQGAIFFWKRSVFFVTTQTGKWNRASRDAADARERTRRKAQAQGTTGRKSQNRKTGQARRAA